MSEGPKRRPNGTILPGTGALNPGGKPKGIERRLRDLVTEQIQNWDGKSIDGWEAMGLMLYKVAMGERPPGQGEITITVKDRMAAAQILFDRVYGKAKIQIESENTVHSGLATVDVDNLSPDEMDALEAHVESIAARAMGKTVGKVIAIAPCDIEETYPGDDAVQEGEPQTHPGMLHEELGSDQEE